VLGLELFEFAEAFGEGLRRGRRSPHSCLEEIFEVEVLVGEVPAFDTGLDRQLGDTEAPAGPQGGPAKRRSVAAMIASRMGRARSPCPS
jgi:hypothetical protein